MTSLVSIPPVLPEFMRRHAEAQDRGEFTPWAGSLTPEAEESLRAAIASTPADHPDHDGLMSSRFMRKGAA